MSQQEKSKFKHTVERSRFFSYLFSVSELDEVKGIVEQQRRKYPRARHHCWACRIEVDGKIVEQFRDDGEVGRPGAGILELLRRREHLGLLVVSRVFGGVKLGPGGVSRAFRAAAAGVFNKGS